MIASSVPQPLLDAVEQQLADGEAIVWLEQPMPDRFHRIGGWLASALGGLFAVGILYMVFEVLRGGNPWFKNVQISPLGAIMWSLPLLGGTATMMAMPLYLRWAARGLVYAITDHRVLTVERGLFGSVEFMSFAADKLEPRSRVYVDGVSGDIELIAYRVYGDHTSLNLTELRALRDVRATEAALRRLIQSSSKSSL